MPSELEGAHAVAPIRMPSFMPRDLVVEQRVGGEIVVQCRQPLGPIAVHLPAILAEQARARPGAIWLAQREGPDRQWRRLSFGEAKRQVDAVTQGLIELGLAPGVSAMILSGNSIEHAVFSLAAMQARLPVAPISPAYALASKDHAKLKEMAAQLEPAVVFVQDLGAFGPALRALDLHNVTIIHVHGGNSGVPSLAFDDLLARTPSEAVAAAIDAITGDTVAKLLFTSGSTGQPKAVITTQKMLCANIVMSRQVVPLEPGAPSPVSLDWLPWSHVMGGNAVFNGVLADGGTLYIDDGRPIPGQFQETLRNLKEISPTRYSNVPAGFALITAALEQDAELAVSFFRRLTMIGYGGARLPDDLYTRFQALAVRHAGHRLPFTSGYGASEMGPSGTFVYWQTDRVGLIGLPHPGVSLKLVPLGDGRYEVLLRSEGMTPGYYRMPEQTRVAFDAEGYFRTGDAAEFVDPADLNEGFAFAGRIAEEFKLQTGTFVRVGALRAEALDACPGLLDAVVTGADRPWVGLLAWSKPRATASSSEALACEFRAALREYNRSHPNSSQRVVRAILLAEPPSIDAGELTDKGYINQRMVLKRRAKEVERLYAEAPDPDVIVVDDEGI